MNEQTTQQLKSQLSLQVRKVARLSVELQLRETHADSRLSSADVERLVDRVAQCLENDLAETTCNSVDFELGQ